MAITRISRLRDCGIFRDFTWPADLTDFGRYNLIYGWNGSGKTTLSGLLRALEARTPPSAGQVTIAVDGQSVSGEGFAQATLPVRVFNRDFVEASVFPVGGDVAPIFVLGQQSVEKQKQVEKLKAALLQAQTNHESERQKQSRAESAFDRFSIDRAKAVKEDLRVSGTGRYNNFDKTAFQARAQEMSANGDVANHRLSVSETDKLLAQHRSTLKAKLSLLTYQLPAMAPLADAVSNLLNTTVVSAAIQSLKDDSAIGSWVHQGLGLHKSRSTQRCLFCEQPITADRMSALEAHFSTEYERFLKAVDDRVASLQAASRAASELSLPNSAQVYDDLAPDCEAALTLLRGALDATKRFAEALVGALTSKRDRGFERVELSVAVPERDDTTVQRVNDVLRRHNQATDEFQSRGDAARVRLAEGMVASEVDEYVKLRDAVQAAVPAVNEAGAKVDRLRAEIGQLEREIVEHQQPAEELNQDLQKYLGHDELCLTVKDNGYTITRNAVPAQALSEGERTAIALLYFLKSLKDRRFELANGTVVLDDPVSSLDANALFCAFGLIKERAQQAAQLIILTHNFSFFRQVRNWFHHLKGQNKKDVNQRPARFYMLDCTHEQHGRCASVRRLDPLLEQYDSEYHYLFARIHRVASAPPQTDLAENYVLPNLARRLLEAFLAFRLPQVPGELWQKLQGVQFEEAKKTRIIRFLHTHSHGTSFGEPEHDLSLLSEAHAILNDLLALIRSQDPDHFAAMAGLVAPAVSPLEEG